jgi:hypothetical protein
MNKMSVCAHTWVKWTLLTLRVSQNTLSPIPPQLLIVEFLFCFLCSVHRAAPYNHVNETNLVHNVFSVYFVNFIYIAGCVVCSILHFREPAIQNNKYQVPHKYSYSSWWWTWRGPKHIEVINKIDEIYWE